MTSYKRNVLKIASITIFIIAGLMIVLYFSPINEKNIFDESILVNETSLYIPLEKENQTNTSKTMPFPEFRDNDKIFVITPPNREKKIEDRPDYLKGDKKKHYNVTEKKIKHFSSSSSPSSPPITMPPFSNCYNVDKKNENITNINDCIDIEYTIHEKITNEQENSIKYRTIFNPIERNNKGERFYILPNSEMMPRKKGKKIGYCGYGFLIYDRKTMEWSCFCKAPDLFAGKTCDEMQKQRFIDVYKCVKVVDEDDFSNTDVSTFDPLYNGVCLECALPDTQKPILNGLRGPECVSIN